MRPPAHLRVAMDGNMRWRDMTASPAWPGTSQARTGTRARQRTRERGASARTHRLRRGIRCAGQSPGIPRIASAKRGAIRGLPETIS
jgi:hypothetical protein